MKDAKLFYILGILTGIVCSVLFFALTLKFPERRFKEIENEISIKTSSPTFFLEDKPNTELLFQACDYYNIQHSDIVVAQAILESGNYQSELCKYHNNLFGLYNSKREEFFKFEHWTESVKAYRDKIQYRYKEGDYYNWLQDIGYAEDSLYISKLKYVKEKFKL